MKAKLKYLLMFGAAGALYLLFWPVPINPVVWEAPANVGYTGAFFPNTKLAGVRRIPIGEHGGPEDVAIDASGIVYMPTEGGTILSYDPATQKVTEFATTGGRVLGIEFGADGLLYAADAYLGLLKIGTDGTFEVLADTDPDGNPITYADDLDIADDGSVYFSDASKKFGAQENGGTLAASILDLMEHGPNARVFKYDPITKSVSVLYAGLSFANGVALTADQTHLIVTETGTYSVLKMPVDGSEEITPILANLPGFPDNINRNPDGSFWLGLVSPRNRAMDALSGAPFLRKVVQRLPAFLRPKPQRYGFVVKIDENGRVLETLQDPSGDYALTTGAIEGPGGKLYISSLTEPDLGVLER